MSVNRSKNSTPSSMTRMSPLSFKPNFFEVGKQKMKVALINARFHKSVNNLNKIFLESSPDILKA